MAKLRQYLPFARDVVSTGLFKGVGHLLKSSWDLYVSDYDPDPEDIRNLKIKHPKYLYDKNSFYSWESFENHWDNDEYHACMKILAGLTGILWDKRKKPSNLDQFFREFLTEYIEIPYEG